MLLKPQPLDLVSADGKRVVARHWQPEIDSLIKLAAKDEQVTRIFVNPAIKSNCAPTPAAIATGCAKCARGSAIAPICMCACAVRRRVWNVKIRPRRRRETAAAPSWKAGSCRKTGRRIAGETRTAAAAAILSGAAG